MVISDAFSFVFNASGAIRPFTIENRLASSRSTRLCSQFVPHGRLRKIAVHARVLQLYEQHLRSYDSAGILRLP